MNDQHVMTTGRVVTLLGGPWDGGKRWTSDAAIGLRVRGVRRREVTCDDGVIEILACPGDDRYARVSPDTFQYVEDE